VNEELAASWLEGPAASQLRRIACTGLTIYDRTVTEKNTKLYARIRPKLDLVKDEELLILWFEFRDLSEEAIRKMAITYGPWEKNDLERRVEESFSVEFAE
jgi:hypothetical protein